MRTFSGRMVDLKNFSEQDIDLRDIAISLCRQNRYLGHTAMPWSVAQHSILCGMIAQIVGLSSSLQQAIFIHDVHETWFQDIISPIIHEYATQSYKEDQKKADRVIFKFFGLEHHLDNEMSIQMTKLVDKVACVIEQIFLRPGYDYTIDRGSWSHEVTRMVDFLISEGFVIDKTLINMQPNVCGQQFYEVLAVMHFEATTGTEIVVDAPSA